ncbi:hypothetical protein CBR_g11906 [Chara braunii]|uniref:Reverse transcriptase/retrotransposon-derived protein RNase H-like domain-containing protein n=1 Tax=Chara braunii TaxID=69332 RepID=A0A388KQM0_CHABU|nr:hypothetical protein CBR_g11906 [Chara braunii]|eukprot:GBG72327.1 hypothetical protein CBR_g11906 [Chara braunii]
MGICNAPATFQRAMNVTFQSFINKTRLAQGMVNFCVIVYMDDIMLYSKFISWTCTPYRMDTWSAARCRLQNRSGEKRVFPVGDLVPRVCGNSGRLEVGIGKSGHASGRAHTYVSDAGSGLHGLASYYHRFIKGFAAIARPLTNLLRKDQPLTWDEECKRAFSTLKEALASTSILIRPDPGKSFILMTDWQPEVISAILAEKGKDGREHVVEYASQTMPDERKNDSAPQGECYGVVWGIQHFHPYLYGQKFLLVTDHELLLALKKLTYYTGMIGRWAVRLQEDNFDIAHRSKKGEDEVELLVVQAWRTDVEGDLLGLVFETVEKDHLPPIYRELLVLLTQLIDDLPLDIISCHDNNPAPHILTRSLTPYLQWSACLESDPDNCYYPSTENYPEIQKVVSDLFYECGYLTVHTSEEEDSSEEEEEGGNIEEESSEDQGGEHIEEEPERSSGAEKERGEEGQGRQEDDPTAVERK